MTLISHVGDPRGFRRFSLHQESGIRLAGDTHPWQASITFAALHQTQANGTHHAVLVRNLSMTGLYFVSKLPYREGLEMEVRMPLKYEVVHVTGVVQRLDRPAWTVEGVLNGYYGCGVNFIYGRISQAARRAIMEFLLSQSYSMPWNELPNFRSQFPHPRFPQNA